MRLVKRISIGALLGGWMGLALAVGAVTQADAQNTKPAASSDGWVAKDDWQQRVLQRGPTTHSGPEQAKADQQRTLQWSASRQDAVKATAYTASQASQPEEEIIEEIAPGDEQILLAPLRTDEAYDSFEMGAPEGCTGDSCGYCGGECYGGCGPGVGTLCSPWWMRDLSFMVGAEAFKGPVDQGRNGNFGLHEGVSFGAPLGGPLGWGYEVGFLTTQTNLSGDEATGQYRREPRNQFFFTVGIFHRCPCGGWQWGVAFDLLRDTYYADIDLKQLRAQLGYVLPGGQVELGYWGAYGQGEDEIVLDETTLLLEPTDLHAFYYRRLFSGGGEGRIWGGFTGKGDGLLGADLRVPLGDGLAIENSVNYLIPEEGRNGLGQAEESWGVSIRLVWTLGQSAQCAQQSPYRPLMGVADNSTFMYDALAPLSEE